MDPLENCRAILRHAFDCGITHFDLANNYGQPPGSAEENFGKILRKDFRSHRDELIISSKAGWKMWGGPYGDWGSKKYLVASLDQSLERMDLDYVDIFYHHRPDPETPLEETMSALDLIVRQGKALYAGISSYSPDETLKASGNPPVGDWFPGTGVFVVRAERFDPDGISRRHNGRNHPQGKDFHSQHEDGRNPRRSIRRRWRLFGARTASGPIRDYS